MNVKRKVTWKDIFNNFKSVYPRLSKEARDYCPYNYMSIVVYLEDGTKVITLVKSVFSFTRTLERRRGLCGNNKRCAWCVSQIGAHFLFALNSYLSMERVIVWERNRIRIFRVS